ncbi:hypothetical protein [Mycobacterium sp. shizuoka-1]|uniref:hypothetical protein n=1 Tax=Mycobacterium sp. shizuoka-1 TaxID=2039281 RepID=UPI001E50526C|nr:hypothetical protein [Mycobacterium sp. shizuoka-1]
MSSTRRAASVKPSAEAGTVTAPSTTVRAAAVRRTPSATALAAASTTAAASDHPGVLAVPTPNKILQSLEEFGHNVYLTVANQVSGTQANLNLLRDDLANVFGISRVTITTPGVYGNAAQNKQYYVGMQDFYSAAIATVASAYGQLTGTAPDLAGFTAAALNTESLVYPGYKIYRGVDANWFVKWTDSYELLQDKNVRIISRIYYGEQKTRAINDLAAGLQDPTKVMIVAITGTVDGRTTPGEKIVTVIGLDTTRNIVTINDPTQANGQGLEMNFDDFVDEWSSQNYRLVTAQLAASSSTPLPAPATKLTWALPAPNEIGQALQNAGKAVALLVVHQIEGAQANLGDLANDLGYTFGINDPDIGPPAPESIEYGNYTKNYPYFVYQGNYPTCLLMATAAVIGQLRGGAMPADLGQQIYDLATSTPSGVYPDETIYEPTGTGRNGLHWGTNSADAVKLLNMNGINADWTTFLKSQGDVAMDTMTSALSQNQGVIVALSSNVIWNAYTRKYFNETRREPGPNGPQSDHAVVVISVDMTKKVVYINDSALENGQGFPIPLDEFTKAWQYSNYSLITAEPAAT